jgi:hypothetical protein
MQLLAPDSCDSGAVGLQQQSFLCNNQSRVESPSSQPLASRDRPALSASPDSGPSPTTIGYYSDRDVKRESRLLPGNSSFLREQRLDNDSPPDQYSLAFPGASGSSSLYLHDEGSSSVPQLHHYYTVVPSHPAANGHLTDVRNDIPRQDQQSNFDILQPNQRGGKRGPFKDPSLRETRRIGSCIRCRMQRIRVGSLSPISNSVFLPGVTLGGPRQSLTTGLLVRA